MKHEPHGLALGIERKIVGDFGIDAAPFQPVLDTGADENIIVGVLVVLHDDVQIKIAARLKFVPELGDRLFIRFFLE